MCLCVCDVRERASERERSHKCVRVRVSNVASQFAHSHSGSSRRLSGVHQITRTHTHTHTHAIDLALQTVTVMDGYSLASIFTPECLPSCLHKSSNMRKQ